MARPFRSIRFSSVLGAAGLLTLGNPARVQGTPPVIAQQPQSLSVSLGANVTFRITATGSGPLNYQWVHNGSAIANATNATLSLTNLALISAGSYVAMITNALGSATSQAATL